MENLLEKLRGIEINCLKQYFKKNISVLEIDGGNGYQAKLISSWGCEVKSIDVTDQSEWNNIYYPVQQYDGEMFPFPDKNFDIVFSSNVLEHIKDLPLTMSEIKRVLKPNGLSIHLVPTSSWRFWTSLSHYIYILKRIFQSKSSVSESHKILSIQEKLNSPRLLSVVSRVLIAGSHGEYPNAISELYYFSQHHWTKLFHNNNFEIAEINKNNLFYTGYSIFSDLSIETRQRLSSFLGSSCHIFITKSKIND